MTSPPGSLLVARRHPRVEHRPAGIVETMGPQISELAGLAGLPPDPWQSDSHELMGALREDGSFAAKDYAEWIARQQGKTGGIGVPRILAGLFLLPERLFLWSAHEQRASTEAFEILRDALLELGSEVKPDLIEIPPLDMAGAFRETLYCKVMSANGKEGFRLWSRDRRREWRKRVLMVSRSKGSGRSAAADVRVVDETYAYTPTQQSAMAPTRLAKPYSQTLYLSTPPLKGDEGKVMYRLQERAEEERDPDLGYRDWGLSLTLDEFLRWGRARQREFLHDVENWQATLPALGLGRVTSDSVRLLIAEFAEFADAAREVFGCWPVRITDDGGAWSIVSEDEWNGRGRGDKDAWGPTVAFAVAAPPDQDWASISVAGYDLDGSEILVQLARYERGTAWVVAEAVALDGRHPGSVWAIDPRGPAGHLVAALDKAGLEIVEPSGLEVAHADQRFVRGIADDPVIRHFDQEALGIAAKRATWKDYGDGRRFMRRGGTDISPLESGSLAVWAAEDFADSGGGPLAVPAGLGAGGSVAGDDIARMGF
jgi:hypothetical protein